MGDILSTDADQAISALQNEISRVMEYAITPSILAEAARLVDAHVLRSLDAIQLATAIFARNGASSGTRLLFIASDTRLLAGAEAEAFAIWDPGARLSLP